MKRLLKISALSFFAIFLWAALFEIKTCACGDKVSLAERSVEWTKATGRQFIDHLQHQSSQKR